MRGTAAAADPGVMEQRGPHRQGWTLAAPTGRLVAVRPHRRGVTRRRVLEGAAAVAAVSAVGVGGSARRSSAYSSAAALALTGALTMLRLECDFWRRGLDAGILAGQDLEIATEILGHGEDQEELIREALRTRGDQEPDAGEFVYPDGTFAARDAFLTLGAELEEIWVGALQGLIPTIPDPDLFGVAAAIVGVKSRHAAVVASLAGRDPLPAPVEQALTVAEFLDHIARFRGA